MKLFSDPEFWKAISAFAWPIVILIIAWRFRDMIETLLSRDTVAIKVAGMEISVAQAAEQSGKMASDVQDRILEIEKRIASLPVIPEKGSTIAGSSANIKSPSAILWVDDYPSNNALLIDNLRNSGIEVRTELSTVSGLKALRNGNFRKVITDLGRVEDGGDNPFAGLELIEKIRASGNTLPIYVYAGSRGEENSERLLAAGASFVGNSTVDLLNFAKSR